MVVCYFRFRLFLFGLVRLGEVSLGSVWFCLVSLGNNGLACVWFGLLGDVGHFGITSCDVGITWGLLGGVSG